MKLKYYYYNTDRNSTRKVAEHSKFISNKAILKEAGGVTKVDIYEIKNKYDVNGEQKEEYITTLFII